MAGVKEGGQLSGDRCACCGQLRRRAEDARPGQTTEATVQKTGRLEERGTGEAVIRQCNGHHLEGAGEGGGGGVGAVVEAAEGRVETGEMGRGDQRAVEGGQGGVHCTAIATCQH